MTIEALLAAMDRNNIQESDLDTFFGSIASNNRIAQLRQKQQAIEEEIKKNNEPLRNDLQSIDVMIKDEELKLRALATGVPIGK
mgnify:FL=1